MNLEKLYQEMGGDMADAVRRLGSIAAVERFLRMFAGDDTFAMLRGSDMQRASALYPETAAAYREACAAIGDLETDA